MAGAGGPRRRRALMVAAGLAAIAVVASVVALFWEPAPNTRTVIRFQAMTASQIDTIRQSAAPLHYAGIGRSGLANGTVDLEVAGLSDGVLVLASVEPVTWRLLGARRGLEAVILAGAADSRAVVGVPETVPVYWLEGGGLTVRSLRPRCYWLGGKAFECDGWSADHRTPFMRVESAIGERFGRPIASVALAETTLRLEFPGTVLDDALRGDLEFENRQIAAAYERARAVTTAGPPFDERYLAEQQERAAALLERHPTFEAGVDAGAVTDVHIIRVTDGRTEPLVPTNEFVEYEIYRRQKDAHRTGVVVRYSRPENAVFVLLSSNSVTWRLELSGSAEPNAVLVTSSPLSFVDGLAPSVPLSIQSHHLGDRGYPSAPRTEEEWSALEREMQERFPNAAIHRHHHTNTPLVTVR